MILALNSLSHGTSYYLLYLQTRRVYATYDAQVLHVTLYTCLEPTAMVLTPGIRLQRK